MSGLITISAHSQLTKLISIIVGRNLKIWPPIAADLKLGVSRVARWYNFGTKNPNFWNILEGLAMEDVGIF
jgi:hypothetical protein